jgi:hypothetical protein
MSLDEEMREDLAGTTAICVIVKDQQLYCVWSRNEFLCEKKINKFNFRGMLVIVEQ